MTVKNNQNISLAAWLGKFGLYFVLLIGVLISIGPFYWMFIGATHSSGEIFSIPPNFLPGDKLAENFRGLRDQIPFPAGIVQLSAHNPALHDVRGPHKRPFRVRVRQVPLQGAGRHLLRAPPGDHDPLPGNAYTPLPNDDGDRLAQHLSGDNPAEPRLPVRHLPDASEHAGHPGRPARSRPRGRLRRVADLLEHSAYR